jgi:hypothetical protein
MDLHPIDGGGDCLLHSIIQSLTQNATLQQPLVLQMPHLRRTTHSYMTRSEHRRATTARNLATLKEIDLILPRGAGTPNEWLEMWAMEPLQHILKLISMPTTSAELEPHTHTTLIVSDPSLLTLHIHHSGNDHFEYLHPR